MKKSLLFFLLASSCLGMSAQSATPVITVTYPADGTQHELNFGSAVAEENVVTIDWGDGNIVEGATLKGVYDDYNVTATTVTGTPVGTGVVKIYATQPLNDFECTSNMNGTGATQLDVTLATELTSLSANGNKLTTLDLSKNTKLLDAELNNNLLTEVKLPASLTKLNLQGNKLTSFDGSALTALTTLYLSNNAISTLDLSANTKLKNIYVLNCGLESFTLGANTTSKLYVSVNNNKLTSLDVTEATGLSGGRLFAMNNNLTELKYASIGTANIAGNCFTLTTLPYSNIKTLTYAPQQAMAISPIAETIDLSAQNNITGLATAAQTTTYTWYTTSGTQLVEGTDYTADNGKFTFIKDQTDSVYCTMATAAFPKFTGANIFKTTAVPVTVTTGINAINGSAKAANVEAYTLDGRKADANNLRHGVYVLRSEGKARKVIVK